MHALAHPVPRKQPGRFRFVSPTYTQSKDVAWEYLKRPSCVIDFISRPGWFFKDYISELNNREYTGNAISRTTLL